MEEILKTIEKEVEELKIKKEELTNLENESDAAREEWKKAQKEAEGFADKESGFYKEFAEKANNAEDAFKKTDIKRMNKNSEISYAITVKKENILNKISAEKQYIDENRNVDLTNVDLQALKEEKEKLEKEIELNNTPREEFDKLSDSEKMEVRKAKENYLNNKHRLDEINPTIKLMDALDGKEPIDRYKELDDLMKTVEQKFNEKDFEELASIAGTSIEEQETVEEKAEEEKEKTAEKSEIEGLEDKIVEESEKEVKEDNENNNATKVVSENVQNRNINPAARTVVNNYGMKKEESNENIQNDVKDIFFDVSDNKVFVNGKDTDFYKKALKNKSKLLKDENLNIKELFKNDKRAMRNIDYALLSYLNHDQAMEYLNVIIGGGITGTLEESVEKLNKTLNVTYEFNKENGIFADLKAKRIARNAHKLGIAELNGISEKGIFEDMISKIKGTKLFGAKTKVKALDDGEKTKAQEHKQKTIKLINEDRRLDGLRDEIKVDNRGNRIEKNAIEEHKKAEYSKLVNQKYMESLDSEFDKALEKRFEDEKGEKSE